MAKRKNEWNEAIKEKRKKLGRGTGEFEKYQSWISAQDFSSSGSMFRVNGVKVKRMYQLFSKTMYDYFLLCEYNDQIIDIKEFYPLHDAYEVLDYPDDIDYKKVRDKKSGELYVPTVSFMLRCVDEDGCEYDVARSVKYASELRKKSVQTSLEVLRRYFECVDVSWQLVTNKEIDKTVIQNIEFFREGADLALDYEYTSEYLEELSDVLLSRLEMSVDKLIDEIRLIQKDYSIDRGIAMALLKNLFWNKRLKWILSEKFEINSYCSGVVIEPGDTEQGVG